MTAVEEVHAIDRASLRYRVGAACGYWTGSATLTIDPAGIVLRPGPVMRAATGLPEIVAGGREVQYVHVRLGRGAGILTVVSPECATVVVVGLWARQRDRVLSALRESRIDVQERRTWFVPYSRAPEGPKVISPAFVVVCAALIIVLGALTSLLVAACLAVIGCLGALGLVLLERRRLIQRRDSGAARVQHPGARGERR
jgi:hypothetical protein